MEMDMSALLDWLLEGPIWLGYQTRLHLLGMSGKDLEMQVARSAMLADPAVKQLIRDLEDWPGPVVKGHKTTLLYHKLGFLADLGCRHDDPGIRPVVARILKNQSPEGPFTVPINIPKAFGGDGEDHQTWMLTDAPILLSALIRLGLGGDERVGKAAAYLAGLIRDNGWPCAAAPELGKFHGPGRKDDPCPFATLGMIKVMADLENWQASEAAKRGIESILTLWAKRRDIHPYLFKMGTDFCKLKAPFIWYDLLHVLDTLSRFPQAHADARYQEMTALLRSKADTNGRYTAESVYQAWNSWEFGQKKMPSYWITFLALRILTDQPG
jgi:hypothetical protein